MLSLLCISEAFSSHPSEGRVDADGSAGSTVSSGVRQMLVVEA